MANQPVLEEGRNRNAGTGPPFVDCSRVSGSVPEKALWQSLVGKGIQKPLIRAARTMKSMKNAVFWDIKPLSSLTGDTLRLRYRVQPVNAM
jgi:hypothetical protein